MALNHTHIIYDNEVLANEIEDQYNSKLDLLRFVTVDKTLEGVAGDIKKIRRYRATDGTERLEMGEGNSKNIEVNYAEEQYKILLLQNRFPYYDEEQMRDPMVVPTGIGHMTTDMFNNSQKRVMTEFSKATLAVATANYDFGAFVDAVAKLDLPEDEDARKAIEVFGFVNPTHTAELRKQLKDDLKYVEAFVRTGYIGTVAGVNLYTKKDAPSGYIVIGTRKAVTYFIKKGTEVEQEREPNIRLNKVYSRKYFLPALTDETQVVRIVKGASNTGAAITDAAGALTGATKGTAYTKQLTITGTATVKTEIERGSLPPGLSLSAAGKITGTPTAIGEYVFSVIATNAYGAASKEFSITVAEAAQGD